MNTISEGVSRDVKLALTSGRRAAARADNSVDHDQSAVSNQEPTCISLASQLLDGFKVCIAAQINFLPLITDILSRSQQESIPISHLKSS